MSLEAMARRMQRALEERGRDFALVGGLAVSVRTEPRFTRDIDLVVAIDEAREDLQSKLSELVERLGPPAS